MGNKYDGYDSLIFSIRRSVRYHIKRQQFFERMSKSIEIITIFSAIGTLSAAFSETIGSCMTLVFAFIVALFSTIDLVVGTSEMIRLHSDLARRFISLEKDMVEACSQTDEAALNMFLAQRLEIEAEEPPKLGILDIICHNELVKALGHGPAEQVNLKNWQRWLANFYDIGLHKTCKNNHP